MLRVVVMEQMSLDGWNEKNMNEENDQDEAGGMKQEVDFKDVQVCQNERLMIFREDDEVGRVMTTTDEEVVRTGLNRDQLTDAYIQQPVERIGN